MLDGVEDFSLFLAVANRVGSLLARSIEPGIVCDALVLKECYLAARQSITFHGDGRSNHIKQAGHCCFWIAKLKPLDYSNGLAEFAARLYRLNPSFLVSRLSEVTSEQTSALAFPINEFFALQFGHTMAVEGLESMMNLALAGGRADVADKLQREIAYHVGRFAIIAPRLVKSLRVNNYTARGTATMFEWAYFNGNE